MERRSAVDSRGNPGSVGRGIDDIAAHVRAHRDKPWLVGAGVGTGREAAGRLEAEDVPRRGDGSPLRIEADLLAEECRALFALWKDSRRSDAY